MEKLTPKARSLVQSGREALRPSAADRDRVLASLRTKLGAGALGGSSEIETSALPASTGAALPAGAGHRVWSIVSMSLVGLGIVGGASVMALGPGQDPASLEKGLRAPVATIRNAAPVPSPTPEGELAVEAHAAAPAESVPAPAPRRARGRLAEEVAILSRAAAHLRAGRAADALEAVDEHQQKFPSGALAEERRAAKAEALCSLGRTAEAAAVLSRLSSTSPHAARARRFCSTRSKPSP